MATVAPSKNGGLGASFNRLPKAAKIGLPILVLGGGYYIYKKRQANSAAASTTAATDAGTAAPTTNGSDLGQGGGGGGGLSSLAAAIQALTNQLQSSPTSQPGGTATTATSLGSLGIGDTDLNASGGNANLLSPGGGVIQTGGYSPVTGYGPGTTESSPSNLETVTVGGGGQNGQAGQAGPPIYFGPGGAPSNTPFTSAGTGTQPISAAK